VAQMRHSGRSSTPAGDLPSPVPHGAWLCTVGYARELCAQEAEKAGLGRSYPVFRLPLYRDFLFLKIFLFHKRRFDE
jgi:hypothetical protein